MPWDAMSETFHSLLLMAYVGEWRYLVPIADQISTMLIYLQNPNIIVILTKRKEKNK